MEIYCPNCGTKFAHNFVGRGGFGSDFRCCTQACYRRFDYRRTCDIMDRKPSQEVEDKIIADDRAKLIEQGYQNDQLERAGYKPK